MGALGETFEAVFSLQGLRALVTGAGSGLAEAIARRLAAAGAEVAVGDPDLDEARRVCRDIAADGASAWPLALDVTDEASVAAAFAAVREHGGLDVLVNGATMVGGCPITEMSAAQWDGMLDVNLRGAFLCSREAIRLMQSAGKGGRILNLSTIGAMQPVLRGNTAYGASKAGLNQLTRALAFEHAGDGILVNAIAPGAVVGNAPRMPNTVAGDGPGKDAKRQLGGFGDPEDIGWLAVYLAGRCGRYITGQVFVVDGGFQVS
jgi:NAD(P)-dependent dehydrogenase (short-subunit alcohol dehydrogenase family)